MGLEHLLLAKKKKDGEQHVDLHMYYLKLNQYVWLLMLTELYKAP
ncbi:1581_t:CDS:2 [Paraglomus brasilianum]|uniref:1581_t:CDS:1 n=1 Tax=Paraglomus brasilianum TaxID=144538 RepID=A0A9N8ZMN9_9GLOM|nr:1581_t:CDS:2 [Paraglomus brasilianum]